MPSPRHPEHDSHNQQTQPTSAHIRWLLELTSIPTAAGREQRVIHWIKKWVAQRHNLALRADDAGNLVIERAPPPTPPTSLRQTEPGIPPLFITAHLDHPAFVVERIIGPSVIESTFRGGVLDPYFKAARVIVYAHEGEPLRGTVTQKESGDPFPRCLVDLDDGCSTNSVSVGDIARWGLPDSTITDGQLHAPACDDLAAVAAALTTMDRLRDRDDASHVKLLFTRAEEVGFVGAIAACKLRTMPAGAQVLALENSRSFPNDSPIGGGPIVRVGDRLSIFSPQLTAAVSKVAAALAGEQIRSPGTPSSSGDPSKSVTPKYQWQRKLMPGGACEATAYQTYGYESTCICLPLGNYHNMADLAAVQSGDADAIANAHVAPEVISVSDYEGMIDLLTACGTQLEPAPTAAKKLDDLYATRRFVLRST